MRHRLYEDDEGSLIQELDLEAIEFLIEGLEQLKDVAPGEELAVPSFKEDDNGIPDSAQEFILRRLDEQETDD